MATFEELVVVIQFSHQLATLWDFVVWISWHGKQWLLGGIFLCCILSSSMSSWSFEDVLRFTSGNTPPNGHYWMSSDQQGMQALHINTVVSIPYLTCHPFSKKSNKNVKCKCCYEHWFSWWLVILASSVRFLLLFHGKQRVQSTKPWDNQEGTPVVNIVNSNTSKFFSCSGKSLIHAYSTT